MTTINEAFTPVTFLIVFLLLTSFTFAQSENRNSNSEGTVEIEGIPFKYERHGEGEPVLILGSSGFYSNAFSDNLKKHIELISVDLRHFIPSYTPSNPENLSLTTWANDVEQIRKALGIEKINVLGHSVHSQIALEYAVKYPEHVKRLIFVAGAPYVPFTEEEARFWNEEAGPVRKNVIAQNEAIKDSVLKNTSPGMRFAANYDLNAPKFWFDPHYDATHLLKYLETSPAAFGKLFQSVPSKEEAKQKLDNLNVPTLLILGKYDFAIPHTVWEEIIEDTDIDYYLIENASHNPFAEEVSADEFDKIMLEWMKQN